MLANDENDIRDMFAQLVECWNRGDGLAFGELFTEDADYIDVTGNHSQGRQAIAQLHEFLFKGPLKGSKLEGGSTGAKIRFLSPGVAIVIAGGTSRLEGQEQPPPERQSINTSVVVKRDGKWLITGFQNSRVQPVAFGGGQRK